MNEFDYAAEEELERKRKEESYMGTGKLKRTGVQVSLSQEQLDELDRCAEDPEYFIEHYCKIISLDEGLVNFRLFGYQKRMVSLVLKHRFTIFKWPRQMGKSTTVAAILLWHVVFNEEYNVAILANKRDQAAEIMQRLQLMYEELPWWMQPGVSVWNKGNIKLGNRSTAFIAATGGTGIRGKSVNLVYLDEFAWVDNDAEFYTSTYPVVTSGTSTKIIITSTPNGMNLFYKIWTDAENGRNEYKHDEAYWYDHPKRDEAWKEEQLRNMSERQFDQEFLCKFQGSTDTLLSPAKLEQLTYIEPTRLMGDQKEFKIYEECQPGHAYAITVDVSEGIGKDFSVITVIDATKAPFRQVAMLRSNIIAPLILADLAYKVGMQYNEAVIIVENNSIGGQVVDSLYYDYEYENILRSKNKDNDASMTGPGRARNGVRTTNKTKLLGASTLKSLVESDQLVIVDYDTVVEFNSFIKKGKSWEAEKGKTDDIIMTLVMFAWFSSQPYFSEMIDTNIRALVRHNLLQQEEYSCAFGFLDDGLEEDFSTHGLF